MEEMNNETWKDIVGFEGYYQVSNYGRVKSLKRTYKQYDGYSFSNHTYRERILKTNINKQGYIIVSINKKCHRYTKQVHRLVAKAFLNNYNDKLEVNHINGIKIDNRVDNLEMVTRLENQHHAEKNNLIKRKKGKNNHSSKPILEYDDKGELIREYYSLTNASEINNINIKHISYCLRKGRKDKYKNSIWKYKEEKDGKILHK